MNSGRSFSTPILFLALGLVAGSSIGVAYANGIITFDGDFLLNGDFFCDGCVDTPEIAANAVGSDEIADGQVMTADLADDSVTGAKIEGITKLIFGQCGIIIVVDPGASGSAQCSTVNGAVVDDLVIVSPGSDFNTCIVLGISHVTVNNQIHIHFRNVCSSIVSEVNNLDFIVYNVP